MICVVLLVVLTVKLSEGCNKEWLKFMVVEACAYAKRRTPFDGLRREMTVKEFEKEFDKIYGNEAHHEDNPGEMYKTKLLNKDDEREGGAVKRAKRSPIAAFHIGQLAGLKEGWVSEDELLGRPLAIRRRHLKDLIKKCCRTVCTVDDFKGACY